MNREQKRRIIGVAVISGVILVSVASVGTVQLIREANATEVNKYVTAKNTNYNIASATVIRTITVHNYGGKNGTEMAQVCYDPGSSTYFLKVDGIEVGKSSNNKFKVPSRANSTFSEYCNQDGTSICYNNGVIVPQFFLNTTNITNLTEIHAKYTKSNSNQQFIELNKNGGTGGPDCIYAEGRTAYTDDTFETQIISIDKPTRTGYVFNGYTSEHGKIVDEEGNLTKVISNVLSGTHDDYIATAEWIPYTHTVVYDANGGNDAPSNQTKTYGSALTLSSSIPTRTGYTFTGWNTAANGSGTTYSAGGEYTADQNGGTVTLYAQWTQDLTINLYDEDKTTPLSQLTLKDEYFYQDGNKIEKNGSFKVPTKEGYIFKGYYSYGGSNLWINADGSMGGEAQYNAIYNSIVQDYNTEPEVYMYAQWTPQELPINLYDEDKTTTLSNLTLKDGYFYQNGNKIEKDGNFEIPTKKGFIFKGYYSYGNNNLWINADGSMGGKAQYNAIYNCIVQDYNTEPEVYMYAQWIATEDENTGSEVTVTLDYQGGNQGNNPSSITAKVGSPYGDLPEPTKEGFLFTGWYSEDGNNKGTKIEETTIVTNSTNHIIYAKWIKIEDEDDVTAKPSIDADGNKIVYIETGTGKDVDSVKINDKEIEKDENGKYIFMPTKNGIYKIIITYTDGTNEEITYTENRINEDNEDNGNSGNDGKDDNSGNNNNGDNSGNYGNGSIGNKNNLNNLNNNGSNNTTGKTGDTITTSTALTELPKTGSTMGALFAAIASGISAIFAWFKQKRKK